MFRDKEGVENETGWINNDIHCDIDGKIFKLKSSLNHHHKTHHSEESLECPLCGDIFRSKKDLTIHIKKDKHNENMYSCEQCDKRFTKKANLIRHGQSIHDAIMFPLCFHVEFVVISLNMNIK